MKLVAWVLLLWMHGAVVAQTIVHPTGDPAIDVPAVRAAVRGGGAVLLKATDIAGQPRAFDFGGHGVGAIDWEPPDAGHIALGIWGELVPIGFRGRTLYVSIGNDVQLHGERVGEAMTTIRGGSIPIRNFGQRVLPDGATVWVYGVANLRIEGIRFAEPALQAIYTTQLSALAEVRGFVRERELALHIAIERNEFVDVRPAFSFFWYALAAVTDGPAGSVSVRQNEVRFTPGRWDAAERAYEQANGMPPRPELWEGFSIADLHDRGTMADNRVEGVDVGLLVYFDGRDHVQITDNRVVLRRDGLVGISAQANHRYLIERNTVIAPGANPDGVYLWPTDPALGIAGSTVRANRVVMDGSDWGALTLFGAGTGNQFGNNQVEGSAAYAVGLVSDFFVDHGAATENAFVGNRMPRFTPRDSAVYGQGAHLFFDVHTERNVFVGHAGTVIDLGLNNIVTGVHRGGAGVGATLATAIASRRALLRHPRP